MNPYDPSELGGADPELDEVARRLEDYAGAVRDEPSMDLAHRITAAVEDLPAPGGRWAWLAGWRAPARGLAGAAVVVAAVFGALAVGELIDRARTNVGSSPTPIVAPSESPSPTPTPTPTPSPSPSPTLEPATPAPTVLPTSAPATPVPTASDDGDEPETPEPSESEEDNSGPGGGGDD